MLIAQYQLSTSEPWWSQPCLSILNLPLHKWACTLLALCAKHTKQCQDELGTFLFVFTICITMMKIFIYFNNKGVISSSSSSSCLVVWACPDPRPSQDRMPPTLLAQRLAMGPATCQLQLSQACKLAPCCITFGYAAGAAEFDGFALGLHCSTRGGCLVWCGLWSAHACR